MTLEHETNHEGAAVAQLTSTFAEHPNIEAAVRAFAAEFQELEDAFFDLVTERMLDNAVGAQLDVVGKVVKLGRLGLGDDDYRAVLRAWIRANRASGTANDVIDVLRLALGEEQLFDFLPTPPAAFVVDIHGVMALTPEIVAALIKRARLGGVGAQAVHAEVENDEAFLFASGDTEEDSTTQGAVDDDEDDTDGGVLAEVTEA